MPAGRVRAEGQTCEGCGEYHGSETVRILCLQAHLRKARRQLAERRDFAEEARLLTGKSCWSEGDR